MTETANRYLKISGLTALIAILFYIIAYTVVRMDSDYFSFLFFSIIAILVFGLFLKTNPDFRILAWSLIWTAIIYIGLAIFAFLFLLTYGPHGVC